MKKYLVMMLLVVASITKLSAETSIGVFAGYPTSGITFGADALEFHLSIEYDVDNLDSSSLYLSADYMIHKHYFAIGTAPGFFWSVGLGPYINLSQNYFGIGALAPFEFGFNIPNFLDNRFDIYTQLAMGMNVFPNSAFTWGIGLGLRFRI